MRSRAHRIPELLHDAQLLNGEHNPECRDGDPAENHLSRWAFALRRRGSVWQIHRHTSANDDALASLPWAQRWI